MYVKPGTYAIVLVSLFSATNGLFPQSGGALPAPLLNVDGSVPKEHIHQYVFIDRETGDGVAMYSSQLGQDPAKGSGERDVRFKIPLQRHVEPSIRTAISEEQGLYTYRFTLANGRGAKQPAHTWLTDVPRLDSINNIAQPAGWRYFVAPPIPADVIKTPMKEVPLSLRALRWLPAPGSDPDASRGIPPGQSLSGFTMVSRRKPGLLWCYVFGRIPVLHLPKEPPDIVQQQMSKLFEPDFNSRKTVFAGPKFDPATDALAIVRDYRIEIEKLMQADVATQGSRFLRELADYLKGTKPVKDLAGFGHKPETDQERDVLLSLQIALGTSSP